MSGLEELDAVLATAPPVEVPARPATDDELVSVATSASGRTSRRRRPVAVLADRARALGWEVHGPRYARGPHIAGKRQEHPNADGKRPTVLTATVEESFALRVSDPSGRSVALLWCAGAVEAWTWVDCDHPAGRCPRRAEDDVAACSFHQISADTAKTLIETGPRTEGEPPMPEPQEPRSTIEEEAWALVEEIDANPIEAESFDTQADAFVGGYVAGHAAAVQKSGDPYGEGYAAGVAALAGRTKVWVATTRRLDELKPGDVILGKRDRWWVVAAVHELDRGRVGIHATAGLDVTDVRGDRKRKVDVVEELALADALAALRDVRATPIVGLDPELAEAAR